MGSWDGAEVSEAVGLYLLHRLQPLHVSIGLYRDDGGGISTLSPRQNEILKKKIIKIFNEEGLKITIQMNLGNKVSYVNRKSNHPETVLNAIPKGVNKRLNVLSSSEEIFNLHIPVYQQALLDSGYEFTLKYDPELKESKPRNNNRKRKIRWFNPQYCRSVKTNLGKEFLKIVLECFPKSHKLSKICNRNTIKLSYSCLPNMGRKILADTNKKLKPEVDRVEKLCVGHRRGNDCPVVEKVCNRVDNIYNAKIQCNDNTIYNYIGMSAPPLRHRISTHVSSFKNETNQTELSTKVKNLKKENVQYSLKFHLLENKTSYKPEIKRCNLCITEVYHIIYGKYDNLINSKQEIMNKCRHRAKFKLGNS